MSTRSTAPLAWLFPNHAVLDVLALLLLNPADEFYQREITARIGCAALQTQRALKRIEEAGLLVSRRAGNRVYYRANRQSPLVEDLKRLIIKSVGLGDRLAEALKPFTGRIRVAFVFGSVAAGTEHAASDVDLLCVGSLSAREAAQVFGPLGRELQREFNPLLYTEKELRRRVHEDSHFLQRVLRGPKIWLIGDEGELERLVG
jgi:predicted nucleotidyltransferase